MGDRAMAEIKVREGSIYFYTQWRGGVVILLPTLIMIQEVSHDRA